MGWGADELEDEGSGAGEDWKDRTVSLLRVGR